MVTEAGGRIIQPHAAHAAEAAMREDEPKPEMITVPPAELAPDVLRAVIESFVLREGTDYGEHELSLDEKVARVMRQLQRGDAQIVFDPESESVDITKVPA